MSAALADRFWHGVTSGASLLDRPSKDAPKDQSQDTVLGKVTRKRPRFTAELEAEYQLYTFERNRLVGRWIGLCVLGVILVGTVVRWFYTRPTPLALAL